MLPITGMRNVIKRNGHLMQEGNETKEELHEALMNLHIYHKSNKCRKPYLGTPIEVLIPDVTALVPNSTKRRNVRKITTVDMSGENL